MATFFHSFKENLFTTYDVRGAAIKELTLEDAFFFGFAFGVFLNERRTIIKKIFGTLIGEKPKVVVGTDPRECNLRLEERVIEGLITSGVNVIDIGIVPAPVVYYFVSHFDCEAGISIAGSHYAFDIAGIEFMLNNQSLDGNDIKRFCKRLESGVKSAAFKKGTINEIEILDTYTTEVLWVLKFNENKKLKIGIDCLDGTTGQAVLKITKKLPFQFFLKNINVEGICKEISPDPTSEKNIFHLQNLIEKENLDLAFGLDGDGDKIFGITKNGRKLKGDEIVYIIARNYFANKQNAGKTIVLDLACSFEVEKAIIKMGGKVEFVSTGNSRIRQKMREKKAEIGAESKGYIYIKNEFYGYDDAIFALFKLLSIISFEDKTVDEILSELPFTFQTKEIRIRTSFETEKFATIKDILKNQIGATRKIDNDGVKVFFENEDGYTEGSLMARVCNTEAAISFKAEAKNADFFIKLENVLEKIKMEILI